MHATHLALLMAALLVSGASIAQQLGSGTGFFVTTHGDVLTNHHVVAECAKLKIVHGEESWPAKVVASNKSDDLALLKTGAIEKTPAPFSSVRQTALGESVVVPGYPLQGLLAQSLNVTTGIVSALAGLRDDRRRLQISAPIQGGNSGGPVLDSSGQVIGVVVSRLHSRSAENMPQNVNFAIKGAVAQSFVDVQGASCHVAPGAELQAVKTIAASAQAFVVQVHCFAASQTTEAKPADSPPSRAGTKAERIAALLDAAERDIAALRLTHPEDDNATAKLYAVLRLDPENERAIEGLGRIVMKYIDMATEAAAKGQHERALSLLDRADSVIPGLDVVAETRQRVLAASLPPAVARPRAPQRSEFPVPRMVRIRGGCYQMGSPLSEPKRDDDERQHRVCVDAFSLGIYEITVGDFRHFVEATEYRTDAERQGTCWTLESGKVKERAGRDWRNVGFLQYDNHPVACVSWNDATAYTKWLSGQTGKRYRLPTEAEWEYAARAGTTTSFWTGRCVNTRQVNYNGRFDYNNCGAKTDLLRGRTVPVGSLPANPWGLHEVLGNVWEWTCSTYKKDYGGAESLCASIGPRALRGGSWFYSPWAARSASRNNSGAGERGGNIGFRLAQD